VGPGLSRGGISPYFLQLPQPQKSFRQICRES
jgi:hypothetical protein